jgi:hypothetical protein
VRKSPSLPAVLMIGALAMLPQVAKAGPCSGDIAQLETAIRLFDGDAPGAHASQSANAKPSRQSAPDLARRLQLQFSATMARAKRLDTDGDRFGCIGAVNAARYMHVLIARQ